MLSLRRRPTGTARVPVTGARAVAYLGANSLTNDQFIHTSKLSTSPPGRDDVEWRNEAVAKWPGLRSEFGVQADEARREPRRET